jgi:tetratricopeptide (TPR) repeat protein
VQGQTFFTEVIAQVKQVDAGDLTRRLSAGLERRHRLIVDQGVRRVGEARISQYRFRHQLFQKYLYGRLASAERMYLHEDVGQALEALYGRAAEDDLPAAQLARHFHEAQLGERASRYMLLAGRKAVQLIAFDEAAAHFERGLSLLETLPGSPEAGLLEFELTLALGNVQWHVGRVAESITTFEKAIEIARALGEPELFARAALGIEEPRWRLGLDMALSEPFMREALAKLAEEDSPLRVRLLVGLSRALLTAGEQEELRATTEQTIALARRLNDPLALCDALRTSVEVDRRPEQSAARLAALEEMIAVARSIDDHARLADALDLYIYDLLELGRMEAVDEAMAEQRRVAEAMRHAFQLHINTVFQTMRAIMRGEFERAERLAMEAAEISRQLGIADLDGIFGIHLFTIRRQQGRLSEVAPLVRLYAAGVPASASWRPGLALIYAALNMKAECRAVFEELMAGGLRFVPQDSMRAASLAYLAEVCVYLGDPQRAATLYQSLLPFDGRAVVVGGATACYGAVARYLGMLATGMSDFAAAERHFEGALALDARMEAWPWLAHSRYEYASMLLSRGDEADHQRAQALLDQAQSAAVKMGMDYLAEQVAARRSG